MALRRRAVWPNVPIAIGAAALLACAGLLVANLLLRATRINHGIKLFPGLSGVVAQEKPAFSLANLLSGHYQSVYGRHLSPLSPLYPAAVRLRNQAAYSVFGVSATPAVVVGRGRVLLERPYIDDYCSRDLAAFMPWGRRWARVIRAMQDAVERRGQRFLYVLTPSKVAQYPGDLPPGMPCLARAADRAGLVPAWLGLVRAAGVHVADTTAAIWAAHGAYPFKLYPKGGTHWNAVGAALGTRAVQVGLDKMIGGGRFSPLGFSWTLSDHPEGVDVDLAMLMNLMWKPVHYQVPAVRLQLPDAPPGCEGWSITVVGGSFMHGIGETLSEAGCRPRVVEYEYWSAVRLAWEGGRLASAGAVDDGERAVRLRGADLVIYEENEQVLGRDRHGPALAAFLGVGEP